MISLTKHHLWWGRSEVVIIYPDISVLLVKIAGPVWLLWFIISLLKKKNQTPRLYSRTNQWEKGHLLDATNEIPISHHTYPPTWPGLLSWVWHVPSIDHWITQHQTVKVVQAFFLEIKTRNRETNVYLSQMQRKHNLNESLYHSLSEFQAQELGRNPRNPSTALYSWQGYWVIHHRFFSEFFHE